MELGFGFSTIVIIIVVLYLLSSIKILAEYERGVIFRLGRLLPQAKGPGIILVFAPIDRMVRISLRQEALEVPPQDIITRDNVTLKVKAVIFMRLIDPSKQAWKVPITFVRLRHFPRPRFGRSSANRNWSNSLRIAGESICPWRLLSIAP